MSIIHWERVQDEAVGILSQLIKFDTSNPPGNELPAAEYLRSILEREGIAAQIVEPAPARGNLIARLVGSGEASPLLLLSHLDVVPARPEEWYLPPFSGTVVDGYVWGRGAIDCKFLTVIQLMVALLLKRQRVALKRDVILAATADEEAGSSFGMGWLGRHHRELIECSHAINEGGGVGVVLGKRRYYLCQTAEKGICWLKLRAKGRPGHASLPRTDNPTVVVARAMERLGRARLAMRTTDTTRTLIETFARSQGFPASLLGRALFNRRLFPYLLPRLLKDESVTRMLYAMLHDTATPTKMQGSENINVVPPLAEAEIDGRMLPGQTSKGFIESVRRAIDNETVEVEALFDAPGFEVPQDDELFQTIQEVIQQEDPGAALVPFMLTAGTDSKYLAAAGVKVYGFAPMRQQPDATLDMVHGRDEHISVENVLFGTKVLYNIVRRFCEER